MSDLRDFRMTSRPFCTPMKRHYMTTAASNSAIALSMAKELQAVIGHRQGVHELVGIINQASLSLIKICESESYEAKSAALSARGNE